MNAPLMPSATANDEPTGNLSPSEVLDRVERLADSKARLLDEIGRVVIGQRETVESMLIALLCRGHVLLQGVPGLGKTLMARTLASCLEMDFRRIQFTPDLMPSDIVGAELLNEAGGGGGRIKFVRGPVFTHFLLADEINRTPPKTQAALLEAMAENTVSVGGETHQLPPPFFVTATQNPIEMEGTYPLPEAQVDRFMFNVRVDYPSLAEEASIIGSTTTGQSDKPSPVLTIDDVLALQSIVRGVPIADDVVMYAARMVAATRPENACIGSDDGTHNAARPTHAARQTHATSAVHTGAAVELRQRIDAYVDCGASPRAGQSLVLAGKARAILDGRMHVEFGDIAAVAPPVLRHRVVTNFRARADKVSADALVSELIASLPTEPGGHSNRDGQA